MAKAASSAFNALKSGAGAVGRGIGGLLGKVGDFLGGGGGFGLSGGTGQPMSGMPGASASLLSQSLPGLTDVASGAGGMAPIGAAAFGAGPIADVIGEGGGVSDLLRSVGVGAMDAAPTLANPQTFGADPSGGFDLGRLLGGGGKGNNSILEMLAPAAAIGYSAWRSNQPVEGVENLRGIANEARDQGQLMTRSANEMMQGNLPTGASTSVDSALRSAMARVRSTYAERGLTGSTMEAQDLSDLERRAVTQRFEIGRGLASSGFAAAAGQNNLASTLYQNILEAETQQGTEFGDVLADFAGLLAA